MKLKSYSIKKTYFLFVLLICGLFVNVSAKEKRQAEKIKIEEAFTHIGREFNVFFNYDRGNISNVFVEYKKNTYKKVEDALDFIFAQTHLKYKIFDNRYIAVYTDTNAGIRSLKKMIAHFQKVIDEREEKHEQFLTSLMDPKLTTKKNLRNKVAAAQVSGIVTDEGGEPLIGVSVMIMGTKRGAATDAYGRYIIEDVDENARLMFTYIGYDTLEVAVDGRLNIDVTLVANAQMVDEVVVVAFGKQKKESVVSAIETVTPGELRIPSSNLTQAFAGRIAGMISYQTSGEPGQDDADFFIRGVTSFGTGKVDPLILVDNVEITKSELSRFHPDDIESFSILKDATATALYGARGANGVILITTKEGKEGKVKVSFRAENSFSSPTRKIEMADPITYMNMANEAARTRDPLSALPYSKDKIDNTRDQTNPFVYPSVDWMDLLTKKVAINQRANLNISGGGRVARYYIAGSFSQDNGILKVDKRNNFNNNIDLKKYLVRSNININLTNTTEAIVRIHGTFDDYKGPMSSGETMYRNILRVSPVRFPAFFEPDEQYQYEKHILFGGFEDDSYLNPYAELVKGYREESKTVVLAQMELKQDFGKWLEGLTGRILGNTIRRSAFDLSRAYGPYYYESAFYDRYSGEYFLTELNTESSSAFQELRYVPGSKSIQSSFYSEASLAYNNEFNEKHGVSGMLVLIARSALNANAATLTASLPQRNLGLSGRFTYAYDSKYLSEFNFGYNGSEKFDKGHRWGFFPSFGLGWVVSNESFWNGRVSDVVNTLKLRATYGLVGNDEIGSERFFYLSRVTIEGGGAFSTGYEFNGKNRQGVSIGNYPNSEIGWEIAYKTNLGLELGLFKDKVNILADFYKERRTNILQPRADIPSTTGLWATPLVNVGEANGRGVDISVDYNHSVTKDFWIVGRGNFTYARSTFKFYEEPDYSLYPWRSRIGSPISQRWGYVAERLFIDDADVSNSPRQDFGEYGPGDLKFKDINEDGVINEIDMVPVGYPAVPEINYGFGISLGYRNLDFSLFLQGSGNSSFWLDVNALTPFVTSSSEGKILETGLAKFIAEDYWSETSQNPYAGWQRLSNYSIANNAQPNTWFMRNGTFLRLKSAELGYTLPAILTDRYNISSVRFYLSGTNLLNFSKFKLWDVEMGGNGLGYPLQRVLNMGLNVSF